MKRIKLMLTLLVLTGMCFGQDKEADLKWFRDAKFGLFIHWGLYSELAGQYRDTNYFGSGEWIMNQARIPVAEYEKVAKRFNPVNFNAAQWAGFAKDIGARYLVITAKHHEGFSMYGTEVSSYNIVDAAPYGKDPMKDLSDATRKLGLKFGFYYSQYLDWHEPNGGGNNWDFDEDKKDYREYYQHKSIPQLKELLTRYGPLGLIWFDMPGGLTKEETQKMIDSLHLLQPHALFSSRVGQGLGDYKDFGDSEIPAAPVPEAWEAIYTNNDSWGYIDHDMNYKTPKELIQLLANVASKGGNLMVNIGPDGKGNIPYYAKKYLLDVGKWLDKYGESIYGTTSGIIPAQPWGVTTSKPGKLFLHVMHRPKDGKLVIPGFDADIDKIYQLGGSAMLKWERSGTDLIVKVPALADERNTVFVVSYKGEMKNNAVPGYRIVSRNYEQNSLNVIDAELKGGAAIEPITFSHYFGDWKHVTCISGQKNTTDASVFTFRILEPGDYKIYLEYSCDKESSNREAIIRFDELDFHFRTLHTSEYNINEPLLFIKHPVAIIHVEAPGIHALNIHPFMNGKADLYKLKDVLLEPIE